MASTFTGLKLQGEIGKFGKLDLSDIEAFVELPDGKVVSGSETGHLLLWEGNFVKCRLVTSDKSPEIMFDGSVSPRSQGSVFGSVPAHEGGISTVLHDRESNMIMSAGADGKIKWWDFDVVDAAEVDSDISMDFPIKCIRELLVGETVSVKAMAKKADGTWFVEDANGGMYDVDAESEKVENVWNFHSGKIVGVDSSHVDHYAVTAGLDGSVKCWDYVNKKVVLEVKNKVGCSSVTAVPKSVDPEGRTFAVGFLDGVVRCYYRGDEELSLLQVIKPHNGAVTCIQFSDDGKYVATGGADGLVFVLKTPPTGTGDSGDKPLAYEPVGFVYGGEDDKAVASISWRPDGNALLFTCGTSTIEIDCSDKDLLKPIDAAKTFEMDLPRKVYSYKDRPKISMNDDAPAEGDAAENAASGEEKKEIDSSAAKAVVPEALTATYNTDGSSNFLVSFGAGKAGKIYECNVNEEYTKGEYHVGEKIAQDGDDLDIVPKTHDLRYSSSGNFLLSTSDDGSATVRSSDALGYFVRYKVHGVTGATGSCLSWDDEFYLSVGEDGLLVIYRLNPEGVASAGKRAAAANSVQDHETDMESTIAFTDSGETSTPPAGMDEIFSSDAEGVEKARLHAEKMAQIEDITDSNAYSIQDEKLKKEEDARKLAAEKKKEGIREIIRSMQVEYEALVQKNEMLPKEQQLTEEEMMVDPEFNEMLKAEGLDMLNEVKLECRHESEKSYVRMQKLMERYIDVLDVESFYVKGLQNGCLVRSFPTRKLGEKLESLLAQVQNLMKVEEASNNRKTMMDRGVGRNKKKGNGDGSKKSVMARNSSIHNNADGVEKKMSTFEIRKAMRATRNEELKQILDAKPAEDEDDVRDIQAIEDAIRNMGDYKVKSSEDYEVPEDQQVNAEKKRRQMVLLEKSVYTIKKKFNKRLLACRNSKEKLINLITENNEHIKKIDKQLGQTEKSANLWQPKMEAGEYPESRVFFTEEDKAAFKKSVEAKGGDVTKASVNPKSIAAQDYQSVDPKDEKKGYKPISKHAAKVNSRSLAIARLIPVLRATYDPATAGEMPEVAPGATLSELEIDEMSEIRKMLLHDREVIVNKMVGLVTDLDKEIGDLRRDRIIYGAELKAAELRLLVLSEELHLLSDFEGKDKQLTSKLEKCQREKGEVVANISDCRNRLQSKKGELDVWMGKDKLIMDDFLKMAPENHSFHEQLLRIFKRKIKRARKKNDVDEEGDDSDEDSDYDLDSDEDDEDDEEFDDSCPPGCDTNLYENVLALREKRLDQEEVLSEFQKEFDDLKKAHDRHIGRERQINKDLKSTGVEIAKFQTEKQLHINEQMIVVPLETSQVHLWEPGKTAEGEELAVPENPTVLRGVVGMSECALFNERRLNKLRDRIGELDKEIMQDKDNFKGLHKEKSQLEKEKVTKEKEISKQESKCEELQLLKFGQLIDIAELDKISVDNNDEAELKSRSSAVEVQNEKMVHKINKKCTELKENLLKITEENTEVLNKIAELNGRQFFLEKELNGKSKGRGAMQVADDGPTLRAETEERNRLVALVKLQAKEVDALKAEINLLRRKGGAIYAPPPPPGGSAGGVGGEASFSQTM